MKKNIPFAEIAAQLVKVFANESLTAEYNHESEQYDGIAGWCGVMSPITRTAFIKAFGAEVVALAESEARKEMKAAEDRHNATKYHAHTLEADKLQGVPTVGGFFWAHNSGMKCDDGRGVFGEINALLWRSEYDESEHDRREFVKRGAHLCKVSQVFTVSAEDFNRPELADELTAEHKPEGGSMSDDIEDGASWYDLTDEQRATLYTFGALVTDGRRYYLIDSEGYEYPRYIYVPKSWREDLADITTAERERIEAENRRKAQEAADAKAARRAEYETKCKKWAHLMEDVRPLEAKESEAWAAVVAAHYRKGAESKAHTAAKRATDNARKRNILAMCRAAFPGVKFSVSVRRGWGADFELTWTDGPTVEEFNAKTDLDIFCSSYDTFDGMTDCADRESKEFTDFSALTMGSNGGNVDASREMSAEVKAAIIAEIVAAVPEYDNKCGRGYYQDLTATPEQAHAVAERLGVAEGVLYCGGMCVYDPYKWSAEEIARHAWNATSYYTEPTAQTEGGKAQEVEAVAEGAQAPECLELIETAEGVAVVGDSRTTYRHRKEIKTHGAKWNKTAQRWEAVDAEGVESLRQWFGVSASEQTAPTAEPVAESAEDITDTTATAEPCAPFADTREEAKARGDYWRGITYNTQTGQGSPTYAPICNESKNTPAELWAYLLTLQEGGEIRALCKYYDPSGVLTYRYITNKTAKQLQAVKRTEGQEWADFAEHLEDLKAWAQNVQEGEAYEVGAVWQFDRFHGTESEELHEIRKRSGCFDLVVNICDSNGGGQRFPDEFPTYAAALEALRRFRPGVREIATPCDDLRRKTDPIEGGKAETTATAASADPFEGAPQSVCELVDEIKAKPQEGEHGAKRAELLALMAEQWQEKPEYFKNAGACQIINANERETAEDIACDIVAIVAAYQHDHGAPANYIKACDLRQWFSSHTEITLSNANRLSA